MNKIDVAYLRGKIVNRMVKTPENNLENLESWLNGYAQCQSDILNILDEDDEE